MKLQLTFSMPDTDGPEVADNLERIAETLAYISDAISDGTLKEGVLDSDAVGGFLLEQLADE